MKPRSELRLPLAAIIVVVAALLAFWPVVTFDFTSWDDYETIARNPKLAWPLGQSLPEFWTRPQMDLYVPVTYSVWALTAGVARQSPPPSANAPAGAFVLNPHVFHALNLVLHIAAACAALLLLRELVPDVLAALVGALVFALHPMQVEPVAWVSGTKDVLFALLSLIALWQYIRLARLSALSKAVGEAMDPGEWWTMYSIATAAFVLAMLAKPTAMVVPLIAIALDLLVVGRPVRDVLRVTWPWLLLMAPCLIWTKLSQSAAHAHAMAPAIWMRPLMALDALAFYLWKIIAPVSLGLDYGRTPEVVASHGWIYWTWIAPVAIAFGCVILAKRHTRMPLAAVLVTLLVLAPLLGLVPFDFQAYSTVADHYIYLAMLGPALVAAWTIARWPSSGVTAAACVVLIALGCRSFAQTWHWHDSDALFRHALAVNPDSFASYDNLAIAALNANRIDDAIDLSRKAAKIRPQDSAAYLTIADALRTRSDLSGAMAMYRKALECDPNYAPAVSNLAALMAQEGDLDQALPLVRRAIELEPQSIDAQLNLGRMLIATDQLDAARKPLRTVLQLDPANRPAKELLADLDRVLGPTLAP